MDHEEIIRSIRFGFYSTDLLGDLDPRRYDVTACVNKYADLCQEALEQVFPGCKIEILLESDERIQVNGVTDSPQVDIVEEIRDRVYREFGWEVSRPWLDVVFASQRSGIPTSIIRWACKEGVIREAEKPKGHWEFSQEAFVEARKQSEFSACREVLAVEVANEEAAKVEEHYAYAELDMRVTQITPGKKLLVVLPDELEHSPWFTKDNTLLLLSQNDKNLNLELEIEHFVDVIPWKDTKWAYDAFARAVLSQVNRGTLFREHLAEIAIHDQQQLDEMHIVSTCHDWRDREITSLLKNALGSLKELARDAEIELAGGPQWRDEYEKDEGLFCREILGPLLRRMGFLDVRYRHGVIEFGKDFTFSEMTKFGEFRYGALQAKAGTVRGGVNADIDELLGQINDAFENEYDELVSYELNPCTKSKNLRSLPVRAPTLG